MGAREDLKELANSILDSYEMRVRTVNGLMEQAYCFLRGFQIELDEMMVQVRTNLSRSESLRKKDFDKMITHVVERLRRTEEEAEESFKSFRAEEEEIIDRLRNVILFGGGADFGDIKAIREDLLNRQKERERGIVRSLKSFQIEQEELRAALRNLLSKGERIKVKDLKTMLKILHAQQGERDSELARMLEDLEMVREKVQTQWQSVAKASRQ
jgi:hypothetical protein